MTEELDVRDFAGNVYGLFVDGERTWEVRDGLATGKSIPLLKPQDSPAYALDLRCALGVKA